METKISGSFIAEEEENKTTTTAWNNLILSY